VSNKLVILILYYNLEKELRNTIVEHLKCFEKYTDHRIVYLNVAWGVPQWIEQVSVDIVIYHYTICGRKWLSPEKNLFDQSMQRLAKISGYKIAMPQDEYVYNNHVCRFFKEQGIKSIYTCYFPEDYQKAYPTELSGLEHYDTVLPGYLDELALEEYRRTVRPHSNRQIDIGYRARKNPYYLGSLGVLKHRIAEVFQEKALDLNTDISTDSNSVFLGTSWYDFLLSCRCILGVESGSSLLDFNGDFRREILKFQNENPSATFEECRDLIFPEQDNNINLATLSPRHFEAIITNTCQVLVKGTYAGALKADFDYISIEKDFSNIADVLQKIKNVNYCETIAKNCYNTVIGSGKYTYRYLANQVIDGVAEKLNKNKNISIQLIDKMDKLHKSPFYFTPIQYSINLLKSEIKNIFVKLGLLDRFLLLIGKKQ
jgi:hypothetical protein